MALGYPALAVDPTLVGLAGDAPFHCPSDRTMVLAGRATDMARRGYFSHAIQGCANTAGVDYTIIDVLGAEYGYNTLRAEDIGEWSGNPSASASYRSGCDVGGVTCAGGTTSVSAAVARVERAFMNSSDHRGTILGSYDRSGCGAAQARSGQTDFVCLFSLGGPAIPDPPPPASVSVSGSHATVAPGRPRLFTALAHDAACLVSASASLDGTRLAIWHYPHGGHTSTLRLLIAPAHLLPGPHRLVWRVVDAAGDRPHAAWRSRCASRGRRTNSGRCTVATSRPAPLGWPLRDLVHLPSWRVGPIRPGVYRRHVVAELPNVIVERGRRVMREMATAHPSRSPCRASAGHEPSRTLSLRRLWRS